MMKTTDVCLPDGAIILEPRLAENGARFWRAYIIGENILGSGLVAFADNPNDAFENFKELALARRLVNQVNQVSQAKRQPILEYIRSWFYD